MSYLKLTLSVAFFLSCQGSAKRVTDSKLTTDLDLNGLKKDTIECGVSGNLLQRIQDCQNKNPHFSTYKTKRRGVTWQQVAYISGTDFHVWLDTEQNLLWSSPLAPEKISYCKTILALKNGDQNIVIRYPSFMEYKEYFSYLPPPLLLNSKARFFKHADDEQINMVADEQNQTFRNAPDDEPIWARCIGD